MFLCLTGVIDNTVVNNFSFYVLVTENPHEEDRGQREDDQAGHSGDYYFFHFSNLVWMPFPATICDTVFPFGSTTVSV